MHIIDDFAPKEFTKLQVEGLYELVDSHPCHGSMELRKAVQDVIV